LTSPIFISATLPALTSPPNAPTFFGQKKMPKPAVIWPSNAIIVPQPAQRRTVRRDQKPRRTGMPEPPGTGDAVRRSISSAASAPG
jgi:hypothetical protein